MIKCLTGCGSLSGEGQGASVCLYLLYTRVQMNKINPKKLLNSKWTAVEPKNKEKHFLVSEVEFDEDGIVILCCVEAVMSKRTIEINWRDLKDDSRWLHGWI